MPWTDMHSFIDLDTLTNVTQSHAPVMRTHRSKMSNMHQNKQMDRIYKENLELVC